MSIAPCKVLSTGPPYTLLPHCLALFRPGHACSRPFPASNLAPAYTDEDWLTLLIARSSSEKYIRVRGGRWTSIDYEPDWPTEYSLEFIEGKLLNNKPPPTITKEERQI
jgi:hypothetical protein